MATVAVEVITQASSALAWDALEDIGALHTRLVPGFVVGTQLVPGGRKVSFANGVTVEEPIVDCNRELRRLCWTVRGGALGLTHFNSTAQVMPRAAGGCAVIWITDLLPDSAAATVQGMMRQGAEAMRAALDHAAGAESVGA